MKWTLVIFLTAAAAGGGIWWWNVGNRPRAVSPDRITVILVTHEGDVARRATRAIRIRDGRITSDERRA